MRKNVPVLFVLLSLSLLGLTACFRSDIVSVSIVVPNMQAGRDARIVTNAALNEVVCSYDDIKHEYEVDLSKGLVLYHESNRLFSPDYQQLIKDRIHEVGYVARIRTVRVNPPPPVPTTEGLVQLWGNRVTAVIEIQAMQTNVDANIVVDAIAFARHGNDHPGVRAHPATCMLQVTYSGLKTASQNIEQAISAVGYAANSIPPRLGCVDALPDGWSAVSL